MILQSRLYAVKINRGNRMVSKTIWEKLARMSFCKTLKIALVQKTSVICTSIKSSRMYVLPNCTRNYTITYY